MFFKGKKECIIKNETLGCGFHLNILILNLFAYIILSDERPWDCALIFIVICLCFSCRAALVAGMPLCAVPVHCGRWGARRRDWVPETKRRRPSPHSRHEPLLEWNQTQVPQHPVGRQFPQNAFDCRISNL